MLKVCKVVWVVWPVAAGVRLQGDDGSSSSGKDGTQSPEESSAVVHSKVNVIEDIMSKTGYGRPIVAKVLGDHNMDAAKAIAFLEGMAVGHGKDVAMVPSVVDLDAISVDSRGRMDIASIDASSTTWSSNDTGPSLVVFDPMTK